MTDKKKDFQLLTKNYYDFFQCSSAFQKAIRRGDEKTAMFFAIELYESNYAKYLWKRMIIIASEDIGLAEPSFPAVIMALKQSYDLLAEKKDKHKPEKLPFMHAVIACVRARKSRFVDLAISVYGRMHEEEKGSMKVPDYAFDMHTREGRKRGRGLDHFYKEGAKINNPNKIPEEEEFEQIAQKIDEEDSKKPRKQPEQDKQEQPEDQNNVNNDPALF